MITYAESNNGAQLLLIRSQLSITIHHYGNLNHHYGKFDCVCP